MISMNLTFLRKENHMTQEEVAERIGVSRQAIAKWEKGESLPDMNSCAALADLFHVTIDDLVNYSEKEEGIPIPPKGKYFFGSVTVGERGQIVIPKKAREVFEIEPGDQLLLFGDEERGIGVIPKRSVFQLFDLVKDQMFHKKGDQKGENKDGNQKRKR